MTFDINIANEKHEQVSMYKRISYSFSSGESELRMSSV